MKTDLTKCINRLKMQIAILNSRIRKCVAKVGKIEEHSLNQLEFISKEMSLLSTSPNWANKLLQMLDTVDELEKFASDLESIVCYVNPCDVEMVSLEGLMEEVTRVS